MAPREAETSGVNNSDADIPHIPVLIVGAGPTGLLLAGQLSRRQVPVHLIERNHAPLEWDRATVINTATLEVMDSLGIVDKFCNEGVHIRGIKMHSNGEVIGTYNFSDDDSKFGVSKEAKTCHMLFVAKAACSMIFRHCDIVIVALICYSYTYLSKTHDIFCSTASVSPRNGRSIS